MRKTPLQSRSEGLSNSEGFPGEGVMGELRDLVPQVRAVKEGFW